MNAPVKARDTAAAPLAAKTFRLVAAGRGATDMSNSLLGGQVTWLRQEQACPSEAIGERCHAGQYGPGPTLRGSSRRKTQP
ncbi:hypothetical protein JCM13580A_13190 [Streptomyces drozdowiczii]